MLYNIEIFYKVSITSLELGYIFPAFYFIKKGKFHRPMKNRIIALGVIGLAYEIISSIWTNYEIS